MPSEAIGKGKNVSGCRLMFFCLGFGEFYLLLVGMGLGGVELVAFVWLFCFPVPCPAFGLFLRSAGALGVQQTVWRIYDDKAVSMICMVQSVQYIFTSSKGSTSLDQLLA